MLFWYNGGELISKGGNSNGGVNGKNILKDKTELVLVLLLDLYLELESILVSASGSPLSSISHCLLFTYATNYSLKKNVNNFDLKRLFYSKQGLKNIYCSPIYTGYKKTNSIELIIEKDQEYVHKRWLCLLSINKLWCKINSQASTAWLIYSLCLGYCGNH